MSHLSTTTVIHPADVKTITAGVTPAAEGFRIGGVFSRAFMLLSRNFPIYFAVSSIAAIPGVLLENSTSQSGEAGTLLASVLMLVMNALGHAILVHAGFQDMCGRQVSLSESLRGGFSRFVPLIGLTICTGLGIAFGALLLVIPGLILMTMWYVATPACVIERLTVFASMARSSELTKGKRWQVFGMIVLIGILGGVSAAVLKATVGLTESAGLVMASSVLWSGVVDAFGVLFALSVYHELRTSKEGVDFRQIAAVFD